MNTKFLINSVGKPRGHFSNKANRAAKLIAAWPSLQIKMSEMIERGGGTTAHARLAYGTLLMMETGIRVGNEKSSEGWICENQIIARKSNKAKGIKKGQVIWQHPMFGKHVQTFGLTTLLHSHIRRCRSGKKIMINFTGKKLVDQSLIVRHPKLVKYCPRGDVDDLFLGVSYHELKKFVKKYVGKGYTPKDLRMAKCNLLFIDKFGSKFAKQYMAATTKGERKKLLAAAVEETANEIGHTKSVCRSAYLSAPLLDSITNYDGDQ